MKNSFVLPLLVLIEAVAIINITLLFIGHIILDAKDIKFCTNSRVTFNLYKYFCKIYFFISIKILDGFWFRFLLGWKLYLYSSKIICLTKYILLLNIFNNILFFIYIHHKFTQYYTEFLILHLIMKIIFYFRVRLNFLNLCVFRLTYLNLLAWISCA